MDGVLEGIGPFEEFKSIEDPVDASAGGGGDGVDSLGFVGKELRELASLFDGGELRAGDVLCETHSFCGMIIVVADDCGDVGPCELDGGGDSVTAGDEVVSAVFVGPDGNWVNYTYL